MRCAAKTRYWSGALPAMMRLLVRRCSPPSRRRDAAGDRHGARPCATGRRPAGAHRLCPRRRSDGGGASARRRPTAFRHLQPAGRTPRLHDVIEPRAGPARRRADRRLHRRPRAASAGRARRDGRDAGAPFMPCRCRPTARRFRARRIPSSRRWKAIELNAMRFLDKAVPDPGSRAEIAEELRLMRGHGAGVGKRAQPLTVALADTHPGNFIVDRAGIAWFVDLEKVHVGSPAIDLAHATLANLDAVASPSRQAAVARRGAGLLRDLSRPDRHGRGGCPEAVARADAAPDLAAHDALHGALAGADARAARSGRSRRNGAMPASSRR